MINFDHHLLLFTHLLQVSYSADLHKTLNYSDWHGATNYNSSTFRPGLLKTTMKTSITILQLWTLTGGL